MQRVFRPALLPCDLDKSLDKSIEHHLSGNITVKSWMGETMKPCLR